MSRPSAEDPVPVHARPRPALAVPLRAGPLRVVFDRGELRWIRLGEREVLRGIYFGLRGESWATVTRRARGSGDRGRARLVPHPLRGTSRAGPRPLRVGGTHLGAAPTAASTSRSRARAGLELPAQPDRPLRAPPGRGVRRPSVHRRDGRRRPRRERVSGARRAAPAVPQRARDPARGVARRRGRGPDGGRDVRDRGPVQLGRRLLQDLRHADSTCRSRWRSTRERSLAQSVTVSLFGITAEPVEQAAATRAGRRAPQAQQHASRSSCASRPTRLSRCRRSASAGPIGSASTRPRPSACARCGSRTCAPTCGSRPRAGTRGSSARGERCARRRAARARALPAGRPAASTRAAGGAGRPGSRRASRAGSCTGRPTTSRRRARSPLARAALSGAAPGALFAGGSDVHFAELNRRRPIPGLLDKLVFAFHPQAHAFDDATLVENLGSLRRVADTLRSFAAERPSGSRR